RREQRRRAARSKLGIADDEYVVCSFGMLGSSKLNERLLYTWFDSPLGRDDKCRLVFVGENDQGSYGQNLDRGIKAQPDARVSITGFVTPETYAAYLDAADCAVQLRSSTRGETSASILDCLMAGLPTVINAHGAQNEIADDVAIKLPDNFSGAELAGALEALWRDTAARTALSKRAMHYIAAYHTARQVGPRYVEAIEHFATATPLARHAHALEQVAHAPRMAQASERQLLTLAYDAARVAPLHEPMKFLIDISALVQSDFKTGIQRVVRSVLLALLAEPPAGYRIEPVYARGDGSPYRYARGYTLALAGVAKLDLGDEIVETGPGDIFLGLDLFIDGVRRSRTQYEAMRRRGTKVYFGVYDILPVLRPDVFDPQDEAYFKRWIATIAAVSDGVVCISRAVADELCGWLEQHPPARATPLQVSYFHLGADIDASAPTAGLPPDAETAFAEINARPTLLMVGTLEPRKGHSQTLQAFDQLWRDGVDVNLVIVGKRGWLVEELAGKLEGHAERGKRLFWFEGVSDEMLTRLYGACSGLLAASEGEGFGLPLIEAAQHGLPILARDLPVFREVAGAHASYFTAGDAGALAHAVQQWLAQFKDGKAPASKEMPWLTWKQATAQLLDATLHGKTYRAVTKLAPQWCALLIDVSAISRNDLQTGIERVVRAQLTALLENPPLGCTVEPVALSDEGGAWHYRYARTYANTLRGAQAPGADLPVEILGNELLYVPDYYPGGVIQAARAGLYAHLHAQGVELSFLIHDLLPVLRPEFFPPGADAAHAQWLEAIADHADTLVCISQAVCDETQAWLRDHPPLRVTPPRYGVVHHGADIAASSPSQGLPDDAEQTLAALTAAPSFLMVGTIEPRKGHLQALAAFEQLWAQGSQARLVIVGREGWRGLPAEQRRTIPQIMARLDSHAELGKRLFVLPGISDEYLQRVYGACACLLAASEGEGFGLPLIEAAGHGIALLARDIPVFREVAGAHAAYFSGTDPQALAAAIQSWIAAPGASSDALPKRTWRQNAAQLAAILTKDPA
ncbi:MAG TPA: glycosyltransferase, partial [Burkholderiaceae bacterium]